MINQMKAQNLRLWKRKGNFLVAVFLFLLNFLFVIKKWPVIHDPNEILAWVVGDTSFQMVISLCVAWFVGSEFSERTIQSELKLGYSRGYVLLVRLIYSGLLAFFLHLFYILGAFVGAACKFGIELSGFQFSSFVWLLVVLFQVITLQSFTILLVFLIKRPLPAMVVSTMLALVGCNILRNFTDAKVFTLSCFCLAQNRDAMTLSGSVLYAAATLVIVTVITYLLFFKADME